MDDLLLEKIDHLRERFHVSYKEAREMLEETDGNLVEALIRMEDKFSQVKASKHAQHEQRREEFVVKGSELMDQFKDLVQQGNLSRIRILHKNKVLLDLPLTASVLLLLVPHLALVSAIAVLFNQVSIQVEKPTSKSVNCDCDCDCDCECEEHAAEEVCKCEECCPEGKEISAPCEPKSL